MAITPFKDRFSKVLSSSSPGTSVSVPSIARAVFRPISSTTASFMPQFFQFRQGVSVRTANQFIRTLARPVIYAGTFDGANRDSSFEDHHSLRIEDYGNTQIFEASEPFKDKGPIVPKDFIENNNIDEWPQVYFDPTAKSPADLDGIIEPLTIRDALFNGIESPFAAHRMHAEFMGGNIDPDPGMGSDQIEQFIPLTGSAQVDPYIDSIETRLPTLTGSGIRRMVVPGIISELARIDIPFDDSRVIPHRLTRTHSASMSDRGLVDNYLRKSAGAGHTYYNNREGTDAITYGGLYRSGTYAHLLKQSVSISGSLDSGIISFVPPRIQVMNADNATGSYPTLLRTTGRQATLGNYNTPFRDHNVIEYNADVTVSYPNVLPVGSKFLSDYTSSITATATVKKGVSDSQYTMPISGANLLPFDDSRINMFTTSFYMTGTARDVLPGFHTPLRSKTQIVLDLYNSENCDVFLSTGSAIWRHPTTRATGGPGSGLAYYNFDDRKWEMHHHRQAMSFENANDLTGSHYNIAAPNFETVSGSLAAVSLMQDTGQSGAGGLLLKGDIQKTGRIVGHAGFPSDQKFNATGSQLLRMSRYIQHPFLVEKIVYEFSASWGAAVTAPAAITNEAQRLKAGYPLFSSFAVMRQGHQEIHETIEAKFRKNEGTYTTTEVNANFIASRKRDIIGTGDVVWTTSNIATAAFFYSTNTYTTTLSNDGPFGDSLARDITLIPGVADTPADINERLTGSFRLEFIPSVPAASDEMNLNIGYHGVQSVFNSNDMRDIGRASAQLATKQSNKGGGRSGTATFGTFMGDGRSPSGGVVGTQVGAEEEFDAQGNTFTQQVAIGNYKEDSPYILFPEDNLHLVWINQNLSGSGWADNPDINMHLPQAPGKLTIYGSMIRDSVELHDNVNQLLTSDTIREDIKEIIVDQFQVANKAEYSGGYLDNYVTGVMAVDGGTAGADPFNVRQIAGSFVSGTATKNKLDAFGRPYDKLYGGSFQRFIKMSDPNERYYDTMLPDALEYAKRAGAVIANPGELFPRGGIANFKNTFSVVAAYFGSTPVGQTGGADPTFYRESAGNRMPFPYLHGQVRLDTQSSLGVIFSPISGSVTILNLPVASSQKVLFATNWVVDTLSNAFGVVRHASSGSSRGYRYGIMDTNSIHSSLVYRSDRYGQFRDLLEQRTDAKFFTSKEVMESPIRIKFVIPSTTTPAAPINTSCQNLSHEFTSSLPYFDGKAVDRPDDPFKKSVTDIALGV